MQLLDLDCLSDLEASTESLDLVSGGFSGGYGPVRFPPGFEPPTASVGVNADASGAKTLTNAKTTGFTYYDPYRRELVAVSYGVGVSVARTPIGSGQPSGSPPSFPQPSPYYYPSYGYSPYTFGRR